MIIQKVEAYGYPCDGEFFYFNERGFMCLVFVKTPIDSERNLIAAGACRCGKNCKPRKVKIAVEGVN